MEQEVLKTLRELSKRIAAIEKSIVAIQRETRFIVEIVYHSKALLGKGKRPDFFHDKEVCAALDHSILAGTSIRSIVAQLEAEFGKDRAPSRSAVGRYRKRLLTAALPARKERSKAA